MTVFLVACVLSLAILAITVFARRRRPNADAFAPIFYVWLVAFLMLAFGVLVVLIVLAVIAAIGGGLFYLFASASMTPPSVADQQDHLASLYPEDFVDQLVDEVLSRGYYISVLVENSGDLPDYQGNGMVVSRSNDSEEIRRALGKNEREILRVIKGPESAGGLDDLLGEISLNYSSIDPNEPFPYEQGLVDWEIDDESLKDRIESIFDENFR
jgi:hypothetical protein